MFDEIRKKATAPHWEIAWRRIGEERYHVIPNPSWGWCADPFLVMHGGKLYLFAEIFLWKTERNGVIAYCIFEGNKWSDWVVTMDKNWHLSYPYVFSQNGKLFMCPETRRLGEVALYQLVDFPDKWKKVRIYISNVEYVDSTFLEVDNKQYMISYDKPKGEEGSGRGIICKVTDNDVCDVKTFSEDLEGNRCGGQIIYKDGKKIRVGQNCKEIYGGGLIFYEIDQVEPCYVEHEIYRINPEDIKSDSVHDVIGVHTYNSCAGIEVVDLKYMNTSIDEYIARYRTRKVFTEKYGG